MIYVASKCAHAPMWRNLRDVYRYPIGASWIDKYVPPDAGQRERSEMWRECIAEAAKSTALVFYGEPGEEHHGALAEIGAALGAGVPVFCYGAPAFGMFDHPLIEHKHSIRAAMDAARKAYTVEALKGWGIASPK